MPTIFKFEHHTGETSAELINDTAAHTAGYYALTALTASTISAATAPSFSNSLAGVVIPAGTTIFGHFTSITFSGTPSVIAYKRPL